MQGLALKKCEFNPCVYIKRNGQDMIFVALYVDDLILASSADKMLQQTKHALSNRFEMTDMGQLKYFLRIEIEQNIRKSHASLVYRIVSVPLLNKFKMEDSKPVRTPQDPGLILFKLMCEGVCKHSETMAGVPYRIAVGCLMYLIVGTHPDLAAAVGVLSEFVADPCPKHWQALKRVFGYLQGTKLHGIKFQAASDSSFQGYSDADWAGDIASRRSTSGYAFLLSGGCIS